jgi:hypothetical protein
MPIDDDTDALLSRLAASLAPDDQLAFRQAAERALATSGCLGPGSAYRTVAQLWRGYFHPPPDALVGGPRRGRPSKLLSAAPIAS